VYEAGVSFAATSLLFFACLYLLLPLLRLHHVSWFTTYNLVLAAPMFILVGCAFLPITWKAGGFAGRMFVIASIFGK
jgi:hypothetical protein